MRTLILIALFTINLVAKPAITIIYPQKGQTVNAASKDSTFISGHVKPIDSKLFINNEPIHVYENGSFVGFLPIKPGEFTFTCKAIHEKNTTIINHTVNIPPAQRPIFPDSLYIHKNSVWPSSFTRLHQGDLFTVAFQGTPNCTAFFTINGVRENIPMAEINDQNQYWGSQVFGDGSSKPRKKSQGFYKGSYLIQPLDWRENRQIVFGLVDDNGDTLLYESPHRITIFDNSIPEIAETLNNPTVLRAGAGKAYYHFLPPLTKLWITGQQNGYLRVRLSDVNEAWVRPSDVRFLPNTTKPAETTVRSIRTLNEKNHVQVIVGSSERIPFHISQSNYPSSIKVIFYGVLSHTDWIRYDFSDKIINDIRWQQTQPGVYELTVLLNTAQQWGYHADFDDNNQFILSIKKRPEIGGRFFKPLKGLSVILDPGHKPDTGAVGPSGYTERDANLALAEVMKKELEEQGCTAYVTREENEGIYLKPRTQLAAYLQADVFISLHHNALPDGVNPYKSHGTSTYFYHPQSRRLAELVQQNLLEQLNLPDFGLYYDNLAVCRISDMPAILIEPAFMLHPEEEMLIKTKKYRKKCSKAIVKALKEFVKN